jgi:hypothetical protein
MLRHAAVWTFLSLLIVVAVALTARRLGGALREPLSAAALLTVGLALSLWAGGLHQLLLQHDSLHQRPTNCAREHWLPTGLAAIVTASALLTALALSLPNSSGGALALLWGPLAAEEVLSWAFRLKNARSVSASAARKAVPFQPSSPGSDSSVVLDLDESTLDEAAISQRLLRRRDEQGRETISGTIRVDFAAQQRTASAHVAFCPPLGVAPQCFAEPVGGPPADVKIVQVLPYGARFDVRLEAAASGEQQVTLEFMACEPPAGESTSGQAASSKESLDEPA